MRHINTGLRAAVFAVGFLCALLVAGCGAETKDDKQPQQQVDPRFATAEALIEQFNEINKRQPPDLEAELALYYAENDFQRDILDAIRLTHYQVQLNTAAQNQFGEPFNPDVNLFGETASIKERNGRRAVAEAIGNNQKRDLHLVRMDGRWWISGYTYEYTDEFEDRKMLDLMKRLAKVYEAIVPTFVTRVNNGEFDTLQDAQFECGQAVVNHMENRP